MSGVTSLAHRPPSSVQCWEHSLKYPMGYTDVTIH
ncbi:hypothetical protein JOE40_001289 [Arthrobacter sp. PvP102]|jgi:hypothetical protein|nr:hypothetical protein [Arthrobacter sp. PvP103]MBP1236780.1 hypothetical protein [Arthrobacter sp. PvP102]